MQNAPQKIDIIIIITYINEMMCPLIVVVVCVARQQQLTTSLGINAPP
jgi:hypothetical protein